MSAFRIRSWEEPFERALCYVDLERDAEAAPLLDTIIETIPDRSAVALDARAVLHERSGKLTLAAADARFSRVVPNSMPVTGSPHFSSHSR